MTNGNNDKNKSGCGSGPCGASGGDKKQGSQFPAGEALKKRVTSVLNEYSKAEIRSIIGYPYLMEAIKYAIG